ncbi:MAG: hypothetical protein Q8O99_00285 [bacterium]|nr:hypothetical protein [bacterium]
MSFSPIPVGVTQVVSVHQLLAHQLLAHQLLAHQLLAHQLLVHQLLAHQSDKGGEIFIFTDHGGVDPPQGHFQVIPQLPPQVTWQGTFTFPQVDMAINDPVNAIFPSNQVTINAIPPCVCNCT